MKAFIQKLCHVPQRIKFIFYKYWNRIKLSILDVGYGRNLKITNKIYVGGNGIISIGDNFKFSSGDNINPICRNLRGSILSMEKHSSIVIGDNVAISSACLWAKSNITIGNNVNIGGDCLILDNDAHPLDYKQRRSSFFNEVGWQEYQSAIASAPIKIDDDVWIGARCVILKGVHIGARSIIAAGSVVVKDIPSDVVAGGNPCMVIKQLK